MGDYHVWFCERLRETSLGLLDFIIDLLRKYFLRLMDSFLPKHQNAS